MAARRVYGGSSMASLLQSRGLAAETIEALLSSSSSHAGFIGSRSMVNFEDMCVNTSERQFYQPFDHLDEAGDEELEEGLHQPEKKRRLSANQVQFLEKSFEIENKLEPERKVQLARDLGLQPRQVAIWFQNRRARWKTKQLEKDYETLKSSYNSLKVDYDSLLKEKDKLKSEVLSLTDKLLLQEKEKGNSKRFEFRNSLQQLQKLDGDPSPDQEKGSEPPIAAAAVCKQEDLSSANSAIFDSDSPHYTDEGGGRTTCMEPADSFNALEHDQSDISHAEDDEEVKGYPLLKLDDDSSSYSLPVDDQAFWFWPYN